MQYQEYTKHVVSGFTLAPVRVLSLGLGIAVGLWTAWFMLPLPGLNLPPVVMGPVVLVTWLLLASLGARMARPGLGGAIFAGVLTAAVSLMALGSVLVEQPDPAAYTEGHTALQPAAFLLAAGFLLFGGMIGAAGAFLGRATKSEISLPTIGDDPWPARLAWVVMVSYIPLILLGGLVTSSESGMAVRGWPDTFGANMFLYPISLMSQPRIFLEHAHRLFGSLAGLATLLLWIVVMFGPDTRKKFGVWTTALLLAVILQGVLGGQRVVLNSPVLAALHGAFGQVVLAYAAVVALWMSPSYRSLRSLEGGTPTRAVRVCTTGALHISFFQLLLGAMYRHLRRGDTPGSFHILLTHMVVAFGVVTFAILAGSVLVRFVREHRGQLQGVAGRIRATGIAVFVLVGVQFMLGWGAMVAVIMSAKRGEVPTADQLEEAASVPIGELLIGTAHQANGAAFLVVAMLAWGWGRQLHKAARRQV